MTVVVCTDTRGGMRFAGRRTSRDREMLSDLSRMAEGRRLYCRPYSEKLLTAAGLAPTVCEGALSVATEGDIVFIEDCPLRPHLDRISSLVIYCWGEAYPYDASLDLVPSEDGLHLASTEEFPGHSHALIRKEIYRK